MVKIMFDVTNHNNYHTFLSFTCREAENDYEFCRQEIVSNFDEVMRKREQEYRTKLDEASNLLLSNDLKVL